MIALLCDHGSPLHDSDADGTAPLHKALGQGHVEAAQHLLAYGADAEQSLPVWSNPHVAVAKSQLCSQHFNSGDSRNSATFCMIDLAQGYRLLRLDTQRIGLTKA